MENTSGQGPLASVPAEVDRWNWGAFLLTWIWGVGNNTLVALLMFVPLVNLVMPFVLGAKGSSWAWRNKKWESIEQFKAIQRSWTRWGLIVLALFVASIVGFFFLFSASIKSTDAFILAVAKLDANQEASRILGKPISTGFPTGNIEVSGPKGKANLSFSVAGPNGKGTVHMEATKDLGLWQINRMVLEQDETGRRIDLSQ